VPGDGAGANGEGDGTCRATLLGDGTRTLDGEGATICRVKHTPHYQTRATAPHMIYIKPHIFIIFVQYRTDA